MLEADERVDDEQALADLVHALEQAEDVRRIEVVEDPEAEDDVERSVRRSGDIADVLAPELHVVDPVTGRDCGAEIHVLPAGVEGQHVGAAEFAASIAYTPSPQPRSNDRSSSKGRPARSAVSCITRLTLTAFAGPSCGPPGSASSPLRSNNASASASSSRLGPAQ